MTEQYTIVAWRWQHFKDTAGGRLWRWSYTEIEPHSKLNPQALYVKNDVPGNDDIQPGAVGKSAP